METQLGHPVELVSATPPGADDMLPYEELLEDAMMGNQRRFARQDYVEESWKLLDPVPTEAVKLLTYASSVATST